jgi:hypothetical protein
MNVYFAKSSGRVPMVKIGKANDPEARIAELQTGCPEKLKLIAVLKCKSRKHAEFMEQQAHRTFRKYRSRGEWFHYAPEIREFIQKAGIGVAHA